MATSKFWKIVLAATVAFSAAALGSLTHAIGNTSDTTQDSSQVVSTHGDVEKALQYYIGLSGKAGEGIFIVTPDDGKLHFIEIKQEAGSVKNAINKIMRLQRDAACRGSGCLYKYDEEKPETPQQDACRGSGCHDKDQAKPPQQDACRGSGCLFKHDNEQSKPPQQDACVGAGCKDPQGGLGVMPRNGAG